MAWTAPPPPVTAKQARYALLVVFFCGTFIEMVAPMAGLLFLNVASSFCIFLWYCRVRDAAGRHRSLLRNLGVIMLPFIAIPWYMMRRQPLRGKVRALLRFSGFVGLMLLAGLAGALVTAMIAGLMGMEFNPAV